MKSIKLIGCLLFLATISTSCDWFRNDSTKVRLFNVHLNFQDTLGNDLVSGIEFDYFDAGMSYGEIRNADVFFLDNSLNKRGAVYTVSIEKMSNYYYVDHYTSSAIETTMPDKITFKLRCPHIFGDNEIHYINTYWKSEGKREGKSTLRHECYRVEYEGKEFTVDTPEGEHRQFATIILDK